MCSLVKAIHSVYYRPEGLNINLLGANLKQASANVLEQASVDIAESGLNCADIRYADLIKDPVASVKKVYDQFGWVMSEEYKGVLKSYIDENKRQRDVVKKETSGGHVLHHYAPETYGLTAEELSEGKFADYASKYNVPFDNK